MYVHQRHSSTHLVFAFQSTTFYVLMNADLKSLSDSADGRQTGDMIELAVTLQEWQPSAGFSNTKPALTSAWDTVLQDVREVIKC